MSIIYIGDRATGKTSLMLELINPQSNYVRITYPDYQTMRDILTMDGAIKPTQVAVTDSNVYRTESLEVEVTLPSSAKTLSVDWIDTPGEVWTKSWQTANPERWQNVLKSVQASDGIIVVIPPHRDMRGLKPEVNPEQFPTKKQWCNRFGRWVEFFRHDCPKARQIVVCLNKADLFCDLGKEEYELAYHPRRSRRGWFERHSYVARRYFRPVQGQLIQMSEVTSGSPVRCFITSIKSRPLLELPWIYLASYL